MRAELLALTAVVLGGGVGSAARYAVGRLAVAVGLAQPFPWHTVAVNVAGSFALGLAAGWYRHHPQPAWWLLLGTGFCGGFTTFSTFALELWEMVETDRWPAAVGYAVGAVAAGVLGAWVGLRIAGKA